MQMHLCWIDRLKPRGRRGIEPWFVAITAVELVATEEEQIMLKLVIDGEFFFGSVRCDQLMLLLMRSSTRIYVR